MSKLRVSDDQVELYRSKCADMSWIKGHLAFDSRCTISILVYRVAIVTCWLGDDIQPVFCRRCGKALELQTH